MKALPQHMASEIGITLRELEEALQQATAVLANPSAVPAEHLEDLLDTVRDKGYQARRAYRPEAQR